MPTRKKVGVDGVNGWWANPLDVEMPATAPAPSTTTNSGGCSLELPRPPGDDPEEEKNQMYPAQGDEVPGWDDPFGGDHWKP